MEALLDLSAHEVLATTRTVRKRLDFGRPVPRVLIEHCIELAAQAPNGANQQVWDWIVIDEPAMKQKVADIYRAGMLRQETAPTWRSGIDYSPPDMQRIGASVYYLAQRLQDAPALVIPITDGSVENADLFTQASVWGSILPACWSFMLALRTYGLGSAWTTLHLHQAAEMAALLGFPHGTKTQAGLFPVAYTLGTAFKPAPRRSVRDIIRRNRW